MMEMRGSHSGDPEEMPLKGPDSVADGPEENSLKTYVLNKSKGGVRKIKMEI